MSINYSLRRNYSTYKNKSLFLLSNLNNISSIEKSLPLIKTILKKMNIAYIDIHLLISKKKVIRVYSTKYKSGELKKKKLLNKTSLGNAAITEEIQIYIKNSPWGKNIHEYPEILCTHLEKQGIYCLVPIIFRSTLVACFSFPHVLEHDQISLFEYVARSLAIFVHNHYLDEKIHLAKDIEHDFLLARKVESFLEFEDHIYIPNYSIEKIKKGWQTKYFPVYYQVSKAEQNKTSQAKREEANYIILCRPLDSLHKGSLIKLYLVQGYFIFLAEKSKNLIRLVNDLQKLIRNYSIEKIRLEGFIIRIDSKNVNVHYFGKNLSFTRDNRVLNLKDNVALGSKKWNSMNIMRTTFKNEIVFYIRDYPLLSIGSVTCTR